MGGQHTERRGRFTLLLNGQWRYPRSRGGVPFTFNALAQRAGMPEIVRVGYCLTSGSRLPQDVLEVAPLPFEPSCGAAAAGRAVCAALQSSRYQRPEAFSVRRCVA